MPGKTGRWCVVLHVLSLAVIAGAVSSASVQGQAGSVRGKVLADNSTPVSGALVELVGRDSLRTTETGEFRFLGVATGRGALRIRALGFAPRFQEIRVREDSGWTGIIVLERVAQALPEVQVSAAGKPAEFANTTKYDDYFRRRRLGFGTFRTRADIEKMGAGNIASVLQGIPGVNVAMTPNPYGETEIRFRIARCPGQPPNLGVYIDGFKVGAVGKNSANKGSELSGFFRQGKRDSSTCSDCARLAEILASVAMHNILFVEFYRGPGQIPNDLDRGDSCAALVIWTR